MTVEFLQEAEEELREAVLWYEAKEPGLGRRLRDDVAHVVSRIAEDPMLWSEREGGYRRVNCPVFPYFVAYLIRGQKIIIVAVGHGHRKPEYWKSRLQ
jgi:plasmid stabilization system protein ParE